MVKRIFCSLLVLFPLISTAQSQDESFFSLTLAGGITGASTTSNSNEIAVYANSQTFKQYNDSVQKFNTPRFNFGATIWYNHFLADKLFLQTGIGYMDMGYRREQNNLQLGDFTYPGLATGKIIEKTNVTRNINYDYRFHYLNIPLFLNYSIYKSKNLKTNIAIAGGVNTNFLLKHNLVARLDNFKLDDKETFTFDSTGYDARTFSIQLSVGEN